MPKTTWDQLQPPEDWEDMEFAAAGRVGEAMARQQKACEVLLAMARVQMLWARMPPEALEKRLERPLRALTALTAAG